MVYIGLCRFWLKRAPSLRLWFALLIVIPLRLCISLWVVFTQAKVLSSRGID